MLVVAPTAALPPTTVCKRREKEENRTSLLIVRLVGRWLWLGGSGVKLGKALSLGKVFDLPILDVALQWHLVSWWWFSSRLPDVALPPIQGPLYIIV